MFKFAHLGDCHIGAWRDPKLKELNLAAFIQALDKCVEEKVNFIIITGDLFDSTIPDLALVQKAVDRIREVREKGIGVYLSYGSHDFAPNAVSIIDILNSTGLFRKVVETELAGDKIKLKFIRDKETNAKLVGLSGRRLGLEKNYYQMLDLKTLEAEKGFKIFVFHNAITEIRSAASYPEGVPMSSFPKGFDYYAGGHVHDSSKVVIENYGIVAFPGCLVGSKQTDLESTAQGKNRGFFIVSCSEKVDDVKFVEVKVKDVIFREFDVAGKTSNQVGNILNKFTNEVDVADKIVVVKVVGTLSSGKSSDINFIELKQILLAKGAYVIEINQSAFRSPEELKGHTKGENQQEIITKVLTERISTYKIDPTLSKELKEKLDKALAKEGGITLAKSLLDSLKQEKIDNEKKGDFEKRILVNALQHLDLEDEEKC
jgi:DNA repair exonuclease SbcCD nuclease subunit